MTTAVLTDRERAAVQAYLRLLQTVRATLDTTSATDTAGAAGATTTGAPGDGAPARPPLIAPSLLADADAALADAEFAGNESEFFALLRSWCPDVRDTGG